MREITNDESDSPLISVVMPIFNGESFLRDSVESILGQTIANFEILALVDSRTNDRSVELLTSFHDPRIKIVTENIPPKISEALNFGIDLSRGEFVARMDSDDICHSQRFESQVRLLREDDSIGLCGTFAQLFGEETWEFRPSTDHDAIRSELLFGCTFVHPTVMFRAEAIKNNQLKYDETLLGTEDYDLWERAAAKVRLANVGQILLGYRKHAKAATSRHAEAGRDIYRNIMRRQIIRLYPQATNEDIELHFRIFTSGPDPVLAPVEAIQCWLNKLKNANKLAEQYPIKLFDDLVNARLNEFMDN